MENHQLILPGYERLQKLNITISHMILLRLLSSIGGNIDETVHEWSVAYIQVFQQVPVRQVQKKSFVVFCLFKDMSGANGN